MLAYLDNAVVSAAKQVTAGLGAFIVLALLLDWVGGKLRT